MNLKDLRVEKRKQEICAAVIAAFPEFAVARVRYFDDDTIIIHTESDKYSLNLTFCMDSLDISGTYVSFRLFRAKGCNLDIGISLHSTPESTIYLQEGSKEDKLKKRIRCNVSPVKPSYLNIDQTIRLYRKLFNIAMTDCSYQSNNKAYFEALINWHQDAV